MIVQALNYQKLYNRKYEKDKAMRTRYTQIEILLCLFDCKCHTISEIRNKTGYGESTIRRHLQELSIYLPIEIYKGSRKGVQGGGGVYLEKNFLLKLLFEKAEIELLLRSLENILESDKAQKLKEKIERMLGSK